MFQQNYSNFQIFNNLIQSRHVDIWTWGHEVILWFHWLHCSYCFHWFHCSIYFIIVNKLNFLTWIIDFNFIYLILLIWNYLLWQYFSNLNVSVLSCNLLIYCILSISTLSNVNLSVSTNLFHLLTYLIICSKFLTI